MCIALDNENPIVAPVADAASDPKSIGASGARVQFDIGAPPNAKGGDILIAPSGEIGVCCAPVGVLRMNKEGARMLSLALDRARGYSESSTTRAIVMVAIASGFLLGYGVAAWIG